MDVGELRWITVGLVKHGPFYRWSLSWSTIVPTISNIEVVKSEVSIK